MALLIPNGLPFFRGSFLEVKSVQKMCLYNGETRAIILQNTIRYKKISSVMISNQN